MGGGVSKKKIFNIMVIGLDNSGKTTFLQCLKMNINGRQNQIGQTETAPTVGYNLEKIEKGDYQYVFYDMSGQSKYREMWNNYCKQIQGIIFVIDSSDSLRLQVAANELEMVLDQVDIRNRPVPILLASNKCDVQGSLSPEMIKDLLKLNSILDRKWEIFQTNAIKGSNIEKAFDWLCSSMYIAFPMNSKIN